MGCEKSAYHCNAVFTQDRQDLYTNAYDAMKSNMVSGGKGAMEFDREDLKAAIMPSFYGSKKRPRDIFKDKLPIFERTMEEELPGVWELNKALLGSWQPDAFSHSWVLPDGFHCDIKVMDAWVDNFDFRQKRYEVITKRNLPTEEGRSLSANVIHSIDGMVVREMSRRCSYDATHMTKLLELLTSDKPAYAARQARGKDMLVQDLWNRYIETGFLSARILELLDEQNIWMVDQDVIRALISTLPVKPFSILSVHDCFRVHPNYGNDLRNQYVQILYEIAKSDLMASIATQITGEAVLVKKFGDIADLVKLSEYALS